MNKMLLAAGLLGLSLPAAHGQVTRSGSGYLLRVKYAKGQVIRLNTVNSVSGVTGGTVPGGKTQFKTPVTLRVLDVIKGVAHVQLKMGAITYGSSVINPGQTAVVMLDTRNRPVGGGAPSGVGAAFPAGSIKVGQTWKGNVPVSTQMANGHLNAVYKFAGVKNMGGKSVAVVTYTVSGMATGTGTMTLLTKDGTLNSNQMKLTISLGQSPVTVISTMTRS